MFVSCDGKQMVASECFRLSTDKVEMFNLRCEKEQLQRTELTFKHLLYFVRSNLKTTYSTVEYSDSRLHCYSVNMTTIVELII
jgi:hypothetical protein